MVQWAREHGEPTAADRLAAAPPIEAKKFLANHQLKTDDLGLSLGPVTRAATSPPPGPVSPRVVPAVSGAGPRVAPGPGPGVGRFIARHGLEAEFQALEQVAGPDNARELAEQMKAYDTRLFAGFPKDLADGARRRLVGEAIRQAAEQARSTAAQQRQREWRQDAQLLGQITAVQSGQGRLPVERLLLDSDPGQSESVAGGVNNTLRVRLGAGQYAYHKPFDELDFRTAHSYGHDSGQQPLHEVAAWRLAERMGPPWEDLVAPCVLREVDGKLGSLSLERAGGPVGQHPAGQDNAPAAFFDALVGQQDRHGGNALYDPGSRRVTLIDHGFAFSRPRDQIGASSYQAQRLLSGPLALSDEERVKLRELLDSPDTFGLAGVLEPARLDALRRRASHMLATGRLMRPGEA